ncbi:spore germination protein [Paenibacillus sp. FSL H7-0331]|uniref:spore germination protein n=1 Tax=Paenibacillus sp. FSL H7-0331 TaxID=1920421 RepID=UPI00096E28B3|nr:spore germination protein [Paenibacillus sp. FSL H7-0331]OMF04316.1 spore germination protein [Paenibacillus sp. FSL H7-0331]
MNQTPEEVTLFAELDDNLRNGTLQKDAMIQVFSQYSDIYFPPVPQQELSDKLTVLYCEGMIDKNQLNEYFASVCLYASHAAFHLDTASDQTETLPLFVIKKTIEEMVAGLFSGQLILYYVGNTDFWVVDISDVPKRALQESSTEISIKGPKDAFTEELFTNMALIRKRLQTGMLFSEMFVIGSLSKTRVSLIYLSHKANPDMIAEARQRLETIQTESVLSSGQLEQWLSNRTFSLFPLIDYIGRPDFVIETLLRGRFAILVDGSPMVLIGPSNFLELLKTPEDVHFPYYYVMFQRALRLIGLMLSIYLPGFWMAIATVNLDQIPLALLSTVVLSRDGVPFPMILESLLLLFLFELLREAGVRLPKAVGQTVGIVGGLIIGESLIRAGLASPTLLVVIAISAVATFSLVNQSLSGTVSILRIFITLVSAFLGVYGFMMAMFVILIYLCRLESFGLAFLEPIASLRFKEWLAAFLVDPFKRSRFSAPMLKKQKK